MEQSRRNFLKQGSLYIPAAAAAGAALLTMPKPAKSAKGLGLYNSTNFWGNLEGVQWGSLVWGSPCNCLTNNCPAAVNLDRSGGNGQPYWANVVSMNAFYEASAGWANLPSVLNDGVTLSSFLNDPIQIYPQNVPGVDSAIDSAASQYGVQINPAYGSAWGMCISAINWCQQSAQPYPTFGDSYGTMNWFSGQRAQGLYPEAIKNPHLVVGGLAIVLSGVACWFIPGAGWAMGAGMIGIGLAFIKLGTD